MRFSREHAPSVRICLRLPGCVLFFGGQTGVQFDASAPDWMRAHYPANVHPLSRVNPVCPITLRLPLPANDNLTPFFSI
ncbi:MAG: hypothetical protein AAF307_13160 [Pseudomonadota bacterium]